MAALEEVGGELGAAVLAAMAALARAPLAESARAHLEHLHDTGVRSPIEKSIGTLEVVEARRLDVGPGEVLVALLRRPGERAVQAAFVIVEQEETGGAPLDGDLTPPSRQRSLDAVVHQVARRFDVRDPAPPG